MKIGVIGGGQLAQMMALAAYPLGLTVVAYETTADCPAARVTSVVTGEYHDENALRHFAESVDVLTYESENVHAAALTAIQASVPMYPSIKALEISQDRWREKSFFKELNIPTTHCFPVNNYQELCAAVKETGFPAVIKTRRFGYDGKGQKVLRSEADVQNWDNSFALEDTLVENFLTFQRELSMIGVRAQNGEVRFYPLTENQHRDGILRTSLAPYDDHDLEKQAHLYLKDIFSALDYVGVLALEMFQCGRTLVANEMAPRVHNSGHWTMEGAQISQFENHLRAISGLPLGGTQAIAKSLMVNMIGNVPNLAALLAIPEARCHLYGKTPRPGRKLGHVNCLLTHPAFESEWIRSITQLVDTATS